MHDSKKIMILAPHQDDEVILCGSFLRSLVELKYQVFVVFMTNGDYDEKIGVVRLKEALEVMRLYHIPEERVIFMGYANEYDDRGQHIYNASEGQTVFSQFGNGQTYGLPGHPEYCYQKTGKHHAYQRRNLLADLYDILMEILPDIVFATDAETHPDHKANSLFLDEILGKCFQERPDFRPIVLKKPEYNSAWFGKRDYSVCNNAAAAYHQSRIYVDNQMSKFGNPYIRWTDRVRFPIDQYSRTLFKEDNIVYQALKAYASQNAADHFDMLLNSDVAFWRRRTDSLTYQADVSATSGNAAFLKDFKIVDSSDIRRKKIDGWVVDEAVWRPSAEDKKPTITIALNERTLISEIVIYQKFCSQSEILESTIVLDGSEKLKLGRLEKKKPTTIKFSPRQVKKIEYIIEKCSNVKELPGITEIEVYPPVKKRIVYMKIMINDNFIYDYFTEGELRGKIQIYRIYDDASGEVSGDLSGYHITITDQEGNDLDTSRYIQKGRLCGTLNNIIKIRAVDKDNEQIRDEITLYKKKSKRFDFLLWRMEKDFTEQITAACSMFDPRNYLHYLMKSYYLCKSRNKVLQCGYLRMEFARVFSRLMKAGKLTQQEQEEGKCFLATGEFRPGISRYIRDYLGGKEKIELRQSGQQVVYFIGTPDHYNIGDHLIAYATYTMIRDIAPNLKLIEIPMREFPARLPELQKNIRKNDVFILQGGGNMGNVYWRNERIRREIIQKFPAHKIIIFPETIYYTKDCAGDADFAISQSIYAKADRLTICAREQASCEIMKKAYPSARILLTPDIVCYLEPRLQMERNKVKLFYRNDLEKEISEEVRNRVEAVLENGHINYEYKDMLRFQRGYIGPANRNRVVWDKLKEIASAKLVITDRLHAMISSAITGTPCLVIGGYNHKIESTYYTWFEAVPYIRLLKNSDDLEKEIEELLSLGEQEAIHFNKEYGALAKILKEEIG